MTEPARKAMSSVRIIHWRFHAWMCVLAAWLLAFGIFLAIPGPSTGTPLSFTYYIVVPIVLGSGGLTCVALFRFPYGVVVDAEGLELLYVHRRQKVPAAAIRSLELRGEFLSRNVWLVRRDGTEEPLGFRDPRAVHEWESFHP